MSTQDSRDRYDELLATYRRALEPPGAEVDRAVMAVVRDRQRGRRAAFVRWFVRPHAVRVSPLLAAAALVLIVGASAIGTALVVNRGGGTAPGGAPPGTVFVRFELQAPDADRVALAGSFNEWSDSTTYFARNPDTGMWNVTVSLPPGQHQYLFVIDGEQWIPDPEAHAQVDDGFGNQNSLIVVGPRGVVRS